MPSESLPALTDASLADLIAHAPCPVVILVTTEDCAPCTLIKPLLRKLALEHDDAMLFAEATRASAPSFVALNAVESYPVVLMFRDGRLTVRETGYYDADRTKTAITAFLGVEGRLARDDTGFDEAVSEANAMIDALMQAASDALAPHVEAIMPELAAIDARAEAERRSGLAAAEAQARRSAALAALYAPFQDKVDALRSAQDDAMKAYEARMAKALRAFAETRHSSARARLVCNPDGSRCRIVT